MQSQNEPILNLVLEIIKELKDKKFLPDNATPKELQDIAQSVIETLNKAGVRLDVNLLKTNPEMRVKIGLSCIAEWGPKNKPKLDYAKLFTDELRLDKDKLPDQLLDLLKPLLDGKKLDDKQLNQLKQNLDMLSQVLLNLKNQKDHEPNIAKTFLAFKILEDHFEQQRSEQRIMDYGVDTKNPGAVLPVFRGVCTGNQTGRQDLAHMGDNFMAKMNDPNMVGDDALGIKAAAAAYSLADGVINTKAEQDLLKVVTDLISNPGFEQYKSPQFKPPGSND